jgi:3-isopropylmalate/(R)-2-methylmalate dehydratase small subunit
MEVAVTVVQAAGIRAVVARSFSRTYYRNAVNNGLVPVECDTGDVAEGDVLALHIGEGRMEVSNETKGSTLTARPLPPFVTAIIRAGGLVPYLREHGGFEEAVK